MSERRPAALITPSEWRKPSIRLGVGAAQALLLVLLVVGGLGPVLWLAKSAITPTNDTISHPMAFFSHGAACASIARSGGTIYGMARLWVCLATHA